MSGSSWSKALNSFRVISFVIFTAVFLTTITFSSQAERDPWVKKHSLAQSHPVPTSVHAADFIYQLPGRNQFHPVEN